MRQHEVKTICMRDCPDACSIIATVEDGRSSVSAATPTTA